MDATQLMLNIDRLIRARIAHAMEMTNVAVDPAAMAVFVTMDYPSNINNRTGQSMQSVTAAEHIRTMIIHDLKDLETER